MARRGPAVVKRLRDTASSTFLEITITEGRNRQVRRMIEAVGSRVRKLVTNRDRARVDRRSRRSGSYRYLSPAELKNWSGKVECNAVR